MLNLGVAFPGLLDSWVLIVGGYYVINFLVREQCTDTLILYFFAHENIEKTRII